MQTDHSLLPSAPIGGAYHAALDRAAGTLTQALFAADDWAAAPHADVAAAIEAASENTRIAWRGDWAVFRAWVIGAACEHYPDPRLRLRLPILPDVVVAFVRDMRRGVDGAQPRKPATIRRYLSTLSALHRMLNIPDPTKASAVASAVKTAARGSGDQRQAAPLRWREIERLLDILPDTLIGLRDKALIAVGHDTMARRSELVAVTVADVVWRDTDALIALHPSKGDSEAKASFRYVGPRATTALRAWVQAAGRTEGPLFTAVPYGSESRMATGRTSRRKDALLDARPLEPLHVNEIIKAAVAALAEHAGEITLPTRYAERRKVVRAFAKDYSGHSLRVGAAQDMAAEGISTAAILLAGGWANERMVKVYTRELTALDGGMAQYHRQRKPHGGDAK
jgi:integrase/recombinase XerD